MLPDDNDTRSDVFTLLDAALNWRENGFSVIPVGAGKVPAVRWKDYMTTAASTEQVEDWFSDGWHQGIGLVCGAVSGETEMLEFEGRAVADGIYAKYRQLLRDHGLGDLWDKIENGYCERTPTGGIHVLYRVMFSQAEGNRKLARRMGDGGPEVLIETRGEGGYVVVAPSGGNVHDKIPGGMWEVISGEPGAVEFIDGPERDALYAVASLLDEMPVPDRQPRPASPSAATGTRPGDAWAAVTDWADILEPHGWTFARCLGDERAWRRPGKKNGMSATTRDGGGLFVFSTSTGFETEVPLSKFHVYAVLNFGGDHSAAASELARQGYGDPPAAGERRRVPGKDEAVQVAAAEDHSSHLRMAERFVLLHGDGFRYAHGLGWLAWDGTRWAPDKDGAHVRAGVELVKAALREDWEDSRDIRKVETWQGMNGMLKLAENLLPVAVAADRLDADPYLFNCQNGTLDLRTMELRPHDRADLITKAAGCGFYADTEGPTFARFTAEVLPDAEVRDFLQRVLGCAMLGRIVEHVLPFVTGTGLNGKTTLIEAVMAAFGDYAISADPELLMSGKGQHTTGQTDLLGVRLAVSEETDKGRRLAVSTAKRLTGSPTIRARRMRENNIEWKASHTILMVTNHKPEVPSDDPALWRRLRVIPFDVVIGKPDSQLPDKLQAELPAILAWCASGYAAYAERGLSMPDAVSSRTEEYRKESDVLGQFLDERTMPTEFGWVAARDLFTNWSQWCKDGGEEAGTEKAFAAALEKRGYPKRKSHGVMRYTGLVLLDGGPDSGDTAHP